MALKTFVKVGNITNLTDARYCAGMGVDELGFNLENSDLTPDGLKEIIGWLEGVEIVAEFDRVPINLVLDRMKKFELNRVEIQQTQMVDPLLQEGFKVSLNLMNQSGLALASIIEEYVEKTEYFITPSIVSGSKVLHHLTSLNTENLNFSKIKGFSLVGGNELRPGLKDFDALMDILEALEIED